MRRISLIVFCLILMTVLAACAQTADTAKPEPAPLTAKYEKPMDLFEEDYNLFYDLALPENYVPFKAKVSIGDMFAAYSLSFLAGDTDENVVSFVASLVNVTNEENITEYLDALRQGRLYDQGMLDANREIEFWVKPTEQESEDYDYVEGYVLELQMQIPNEMLLECKEIVSRNINLQALEYGGFQALLDSYGINPVDISVVKGNKANVSVGFYVDPGDEYQTWRDYVNSEEYLSQEKVSYWGEELASSIGYGDMDNRIMLSDKDKHVIIGQTLPGADINIADYIPSQSLVMLGFRDEGDYDDQQDNIYVAIHKSEWQEAENEEDRNCILFIDNDANDGFLVRYYPREAKYFVQLEKDDILVKYDWYEPEDRYSDQGFGEDVSEIKQKMQTMLNDESDNVMAKPIIAFEEYIKNTFGMKPEQLYELPLK